MVMVLQIVEVVIEFPGVMGIDKGDRPDCLRGRGLPFLGNKAVPYQVPDSLTPACVPLLPDETVKSLKQRAFKRYAKSCYGHSVTIS